MAARLRTKIFNKQDIYKGFDPAQYPDRLKGWNSDSPVFPAIIDLVQPSLIVEVGTWAGRSAINMGLYCRKTGLNTEIVCIDTWLGSFEWYTEPDPKNEWSLQRKHGFPQIYYHFLGNVVRAGLQDMITPLPDTSRGGYLLLRHLKVKPSFIYIDGSHDEEDVYNDLSNYYSLAASDAVIFGDDYSNQKSPGVVRAVGRFLRDTGGDILIEGEKFIIQKGSKYNIKDLKIKGRAGWHKP